jgi:hypothetical protein
MRDPNKDVEHGGGRYIEVEPPTPPGVSLDPATATQRGC